jgi:hypothetical protein
VELVLRIDFEFGAELGRTKQRTWRRTEYLFGMTANFRIKVGAKSEAKKA